MNRNTGASFATATAMKFPHQSLVAWQRADDLFISVHVLCKKKYPIDERFALTSQTRRAAFSVAANIAEGAARKYARDRANFFRISWASLAELSYCLHAAQRLGYLSPSDHQTMDKDLKAVAAPLFGLLKKADPGT